MVCLVRVIPTVKQGCDHHSVWRKLRHSAPGMRAPEWSHSGFSPHPASGQLPPSLTLSFPCCKMRITYHRGERFKVGREASTRGAAEDALSSVEAVGAF